MTEENKPLEHPAWGETISWVIVIGPLLPPQVGAGSKLRWKSSEPALLPKQKARGSSKRRTTASGKMRGNAARRPRGK
jgi:hypothetical protein